MIQRTKKSKTSIFSLRNRSITFYFMILPVLLLVFILFRFIPAYFQAHEQAMKTPHEVQQAYDDASYKNIFSMDEISKNIESTGTTAGTIGYTATKVCFIESTNGGGWTSGPYLQVCVLRQTKGYYTDKDKTQLLTAFKSNPSLSDKIVGDYHTASDCVLSYSGAENIIRFVSMNSKPSTISDDGYLIYEECGRPDGNLGMGSLNSDNIQSANYKVIKNIDSNKIDISKNQIWIENDTKFFEQKLECVPTFIVLATCEQSRTQAIQ